jgi:hypothetical protein
MVSICRYLLIVLTLTLAPPLRVAGQRFYADDPISSVPAPLPIGQIKQRDIDALYDFMWQSFRRKSETHVASGAINTLGEVPDSEWFTHRHTKRRMTREELQRGPGNDNRPIAPFVVVGAKTQGISPGFEMRDARGQLYFVKTDPLSNPEMATAADVIGSKFFYALGYNTPENYLLNLHRNQLSVAADATLEMAGRDRLMNAKDVELILDNVPRRKDGSYRVIASLAVEGEPVGPFRYEGTRSDDPNDIVPHDARRDLRGLYVFCAWLNHTDSKAGNTLDVVVEENSIRFLRHYLIDFGAILGSDSDMPKNSRFGHEYIFPTAAEAIKAIASLGLYSPDWETATFPKLRAAGRFEAKQFDPNNWKSNYPNPAFLSRQAEDEYWASKQVLAFTDDDIRAVVETGEFSDPRVVDYIVSTLAERREKIGRAFLLKVLALENFRVSDGELLFDDLAVKHGFSSARQYTFRWFQFDNQTGLHTSLGSQTLPKVPSNITISNGDSYLGVEIKASDDLNKSVTVYLRKAADGWSPVGLERKY